MPITIKQIAEMANVSRGTVDKVLNKRPGIKKETREKILKIAKELNYQPNFLGKALVQSKAPLKIAVILTPGHNPFIQEMLKGIKNAEEEYRAFGIKILIKIPISLEPSEQISILNDLSESGVSGIAVFPIDDTQVRSKINQLIDDGIHIITFNSQLDGLKDFCFVGQNHRKGGATAAGLMSKLLPNGGCVGIIISSYNLSCHKDRLKGFLDKINATKSRITILEVTENQDCKTDAFKQTLDFYNKSPNLKGIYITGGGVAGIGNALDIASPTHPPHIICHDLVPETLALLKSGVVDFALGQSPEIQGYQIIKILFDSLVKKQKPLSRHFEIPITISTQDSI